MIIVPKKIRDLFYDPKTDSVISLLSDFKKAHMQLLEKTDLTKGTLASEPFNDESVIKNFKIPKNGLPKKIYHH